jgi:hypothetical protein
MIRLSDKRYYRSRYGPPDHQNTDDKANGSVEVGTQTFSEIAALRQAFLG